MRPLCSHLERALIEDTRAARAALEQHLPSCAGCRSAVRRMEAIRQAAAGFREPWDSPGLWPRIEEALARERGSAREAHANRGWQLAAAILAFLLLGGLIWSGMAPSRPESDLDRWVLRQSALGEVEIAERRHLQAIRRLSRLAEPELVEASTPLMISYREKLMLLDQAIMECRAGIDRNRNNTHLRKELLAVYGEKQRTLQELLRRSDDQQPSVPSTH